MSFENENKKHFVYIVQCRDESLYTGWTTHLEQRIKAHNDGKGAKYTKSRGPVVLRYFEEFDDKGTALKRECEIKKMKRADKLLLIARSAGK